MTAGQQQINAGQGQLDAAKAQLDTAQTDGNCRKAGLNREEGENQIPQAQAEITANEQKLQDAQAEYDKGKKEADGKDCGCCGRFKGSRG